MISEADLPLVTPDGVTLEGRIGVAPGAPGGIVLCHPHPLYGGDMDNPVVIRCQEVCAALGLATLRFNFRGVGRSTGSHAQGVAERLDVVAALAELRKALGTDKIGLIGYSFGAAVAAHVATTGAKLAGLGLIAPPLALEDLALPPPLRRLSSSILVVAGTLDEYCPPTALRKVSEQFANAQIRIVEGANHFFFGKLFPLGETVAAWVRSVFGLDTREPGRGGGAS
jgi:alpha/beta superfamily hydrolase